MMRRNGIQSAAARFAVVMIAALAIFAARGPVPVFAAGGEPVVPAASTVPPNRLTVTVWAGPYQSYFNGPFTTVTICQSGTTSCETIHGVLVDTGSSGLRIFSQVNHLALPTETASNGNPIAECVPFGTLSTWGRVAYADVKLGGEPVISKMPIQIINQNYSSIPAVCKSGGPPLAQSPTQVGYNGILGVGLWGADCGGACASLGPWNPSMYFQCSGGGCTVAPVADARQVQNPVALLPVDNNGVVLKLRKVHWWSYGAMVVPSPHPSRALLRFFWHSTQYDAKGITIRRSTRIAAPHPRHLPYLPASRRVSASSRYLSFSSSRAISAA
jgi:hypothetical protein